MNNEKNFNGSGGEEDFDKFLDMIRNGYDLDASRDDGSENSVDYEFPEMSELNGIPDDVCPAVSMITDLVKESIDNIGAFGIRWSEEDMIEVLKALGYKQSIFTIEIELPDDLTKNELDLMTTIIPDSKVDVKIVKKGRAKITKDNFNDFRPKVVFEREMASLVKSMIIKSITGDLGYGKGSEEQS